MIYAVVGEPLVVEWEYTENIPLEGSVTASLHDNTGSVFADFTAVAVADGVTTLSIPAEFQSIAPGREFDNRQLRISFETYTGPRMIKIGYRVVDVPLLTVTEKQVRAYIGLQPEELPDGDIDLISSFFKVGELVEDARLRTFLASGTSLELKANELIMLQSVLDLGPSLLQRVAHTMQDANLRMARHAVKNFEDLLGQAAARFAVLLAELQPPAVGLSTIPLFTLVPESPDAITGE